MGFQNLLPPECLVIRDGQEQLLSSENLVVGDLIKIKTGIRLPADCRILTANQLKLESSSITGEAEPHGSFVRSFTLSQSFAFPFSNSKFS